MKILVKSILRDLYTDKRRAVLSLIAIVIGMSTFGLVSFCQEIIVREIPIVYNATNPASGNIIVDVVDEDLINLTNEFSGFESFETGGYYNLRVQNGEDWKSLELFACENYMDATYNKLHLIDGSMQLDNNQTLIEQDALSVSDATIFDQVNIMLADGTISLLNITGIVNDVSVHPASIHQVVYLYVNYNTLETLNLKPNKIFFEITGDSYNKEKIKEVANDYILLLEEHGYTVQSLQIDETPGQSMHYEEYEGALFLLQAFSVLSLFFGCLIMANLITTIISKQIRQIGILKAIGGKQSQIVIGYMITLGIVIISVTIISLGIVTATSKFLAIMLLRIGNMNPQSTYISTTTYLLFISVCLLVPLMVSYYIVRKGIKITIKEAINDYGIKNEVSVKKNQKITFINPITLLSLRNIFRKKQRFLVNTIILTLVGVLFITIVTNMLSLQTTINESMNMWKYDYEIITSHTKETKQLDILLQQYDDIKDYELWPMLNGKYYESEKIGNSYTLISPVENTKMIESKMKSGRWIKSEDTNDVVVTQKLLDSIEDLELHDTFTLKIDTALQSFTIVGILEDYSTENIYISRRGFEQINTNTNNLYKIKMKTITQ
ncbi:MAG: FtsX-like permease family protein [Coprobacillaceae bacterium]